MANELERGSGGYLRQCLFDGVKPFTYRGRVRALLGLPQSGGVTMNFTGRLPMSGFNYVNPRFAGEFDLPDNLFSSVENHHLPLSESGRLRSTKMPLSNGTSILKEHPKTRDPRRPEASLAPSSTFEDVQTAKQRHEGSHAVAIPGISTKSLSRQDSIMPAGTNELQVQDQGHISEKEEVAALKRSAASTQVSPTTPAAETVNSRLASNSIGNIKARMVGVVLPPAATDPPMIVGKRLHSAPTTIPQLPHRQEASSAPVSSVGTLSHRATNGLSASDDLRTAPRTSSEPQLPEPHLQQMSARSVAPKRPLLSSSRHAESDETAKQWEERGFPLRRPTRSQAKSGKQTVEPHYESLSTSMAPAPTVSLPPQVVIVQQAAERSVSPAFWERRYLNRVRARVRQ